MKNNIRTMKLPIAYTLFRPEGRTNISTTRYNKNNKYNLDGITTNRNILRARCKDVREGQY